MRIGGLWIFDERFRQLAGLCLLLQRFGVLERQVNEHALHGLHASIEAARDSMLRGAERDGVRREGARRAAIHVARELVEQHDESETVRGGSLPLREQPGARLVVKREKARAD